MKHASKYLLIFALVATVASTVTVPSHASGSARSPGIQTVEIAGPAQEGAGALYAMGCGLGMRFWPAMGWNFAYNVGMVGVCMLALMYAA